MGKITTVEKMILVVWIIMITFALTLISSNVWFSEASITRQLQAEYPEIVKVVKTERCIFGYSIITARDTNGKIHEYFLDTNILVNYKFHESED